jgi:hypothetical protein
MTKEKNELVVFEGSMLLNVKSMKNPKKYLSLL